MKIVINSFSYKQGLALQASAHGGGFVFDCRCLPNPGRQEQFKQKSGCDSEVALFLCNSKEVAKFLELARDLVNQAVDNYLERGFDELMVSFGCTGGQHRSVYLAEQLAAALCSKPELQIKIHHQALGIERDLLCVP